MPSWLGGKSNSRPQNTAPHARPASSPPAGRRVDFFERKLWDFYWRFWLLWLLVFSLAGNSATARPLGAQAGDWMRC